MQRRSAHQPRRPRALVWGLLLVLAMAGCSGTSTGAKPGTSSSPAAASASSTPAPNPTPTATSAGATANPRSCGPIITHGVTFRGICLGYAAGSGLPNLADSQPTKDRLPQFLDAAISPLQGTYGPILRYDNQWRYVQQQPDGFDTAVLEPVTDAVKRYNDRQAIEFQDLAVQPIADYFPAWLAASGCDALHHICGPATDATKQAEIATAYGQYGARLARYFVNQLHFKPQSVFLEAWQEQNMAQYWGGQPNPSLYAKMLIEFGKQVHAAVPGVTVIFGGLADGGTMSSAEFVSQVYQAGGPAVSAAYDVMSTHPYQGLSETLAVIRVMQDHGDGGKLVEASEVGFKTHNQLYNFVVNWRTLPHPGPVLVYMPPGDPDSQFLTLADDTFREEFIKTAAWLR